MSICEQLDRESRQMATACERTYAGAGTFFRLTRWVSFEAIPVEYVMNTAGDSVGNNWVARAGFAITIPKHSH